MDLLAFDALRGELQPSMDGELQPVSVVNPGLQLFRWRSAFVRRVGEPEASRIAGAVDVMIELEDATDPPASLPAA